MPKLDAQITLQTLNHYVQRNIMNAHRRTQGKARKWKEAMKLDEAKAKEAEAKAKKANAGSHLFLPCSPSRASTAGRVRSCSRLGLGTRTRWTASILGKKKRKKQDENALLYTSACVVCLSLRPKAFYYPIAVQFQEAYLLLNNVSIHF